MHYNFFSVQKNGKMQLADAISNTFGMIYGNRRPGVKLLDGIGTKRAPSRGFYPKLPTRTSSVSKHVPDRAEASMGTSKDLAGRRGEVRGPAGLTTVLRARL